MDRLSESQAESANSSEILVSSARNTIDDQLLDVLEAKFAVLRFQMRIKEELELIASKLEDAQGIVESQGNAQSDFEIAKAAKDKAKELALDLKSITQLYNEYTLNFQHLKE
ncbi:uncharacterized protein A4U43_C05F13540 [Asparagus officinalis]|uniref:Uncharacterized protein n=1 Tax=Asparagus officinalis TaxID=4686 RepID=A0A5P1EV42_ASPOF|nr:uncharacterized protein A4U43_C05F13540 [Asparagus officinalis]